jgi:hypothetical protein
LSARLSLQRRYLRLCYNEDFFEKLNQINLNPACTHDQLEEVLDLAGFSLYHVDVINQHSRQVTNSFKTDDTDIKSAAEKYKGSVSTSTTASKKHANAIQLSNFKLSYLNDTKSSINMNHLESDLLLSGVGGEPCVFDKLIIKHLFGGDMDSFYTFLGLEIVFLDKYRNAFINKVFDPFKNKIIPVEESIFQSYFRVYIMQVKRRILRMFNNNSLHNIVIENANSMDLFTSAYAKIEGETETKPVMLKGYTDLIVADSSQSLQYTPVFPAAKYERIKKSKLFLKDKYFYFGTPDTALLTSLSFIELKKPFGALYDASVNECKDQCVGQALCLGNMRRYYFNHSLHHFPCDFSRGDIYAKGALTDLFQIVFFLRLDVVIASSAANCEQPYKSFYFCSDSVSSPLQYLRILLLSLCNCGHKEMEAVIEEYRLKKIVDDPSFCFEATQPPDDDNNDDDASCQETSDVDEYNASEHNAGDISSNQVCSKSGKIGSRGEKRHEDGGKHSKEKDCIGETDRAFADGYDDEISDCYYQSRKMVKLLGLDKENEDPFMPSRYSTTKKLLIDNCTSRGLAYLCKESLDKVNKQYESEQPFFKFR